jgi:NAD(P) transhydrogenase subunit beta
VSGFVQSIPPLAYLASSVVFIFGLKRLGRVKTARSGNQLAAVAMAIAVAGTLIELGGEASYPWILAGVAVGGLIGGVAAVRVEMTSMPEMVALFNGFGGAASSLVALSVFWGRIVERGEARTAAEALGGAEALTSALSIFVGGITLTGSIVAFMKLNGSLKKGQPIILPARHAINILLLVGALAGTVAFTGLVAGAESLTTVALSLTVISLLLGVLLVIPIGGADMPVVVSLLNSYSGIAASFAAASSSATTRSSSPAPWSARRGSSSPTSCARP